ncbi:MAG: arginine--tRNA ligase [Chloroflexi bacterium]|nr:arginine--tRNA ligase [Chloroflexota bacterium]
MSLIRDEIAALLAKAAEAAQHDGSLPASALPEVPVERPQNTEHGDYASTLPLKLARAARMSPMAIARIVVEHLSQSDYVGSVEVGGAGFINFTLADAWLAKQVAAVLAAGKSFGDVDLGHGAKAQVEFVSANPTGPLHAGSGRGAALGDTLAGLLAKAGYQVEREYYVNDAGTRMAAFFASAFARYAQQFGGDEQVPADGYQGQYVSELARDLAREYGRHFLELPREKAMDELGRLALNRMVERARGDMDDLGVFFDRWFREQSLFDTNLVGDTICLLRERGHIAEREGAVWFTTSALGEDKDNVLVRSNGIPTYFASDIAYHRDKFLLRGFEWVIDIWGADHQGHVPRMKAGIEALGVAPERLTVLIHQMITLKRGNEIVRMSKRTGDIVTLREVLDEVGRDACRFFFLARSADSQMDFDLELAKEQSNDNPVYYVQYAHARIASILRYAAEQGFGGAGEVALLRHPAELALIRQMLLFPELVADAAQRLEPHRLPYYAQELARLFHLFYQQCRVVVTEEPELSRARLSLVKAAQIVLANALGLMGVNAPEQM